MLIIIIKLTQQNLTLKNQPTNQPINSEISGFTLEPNLLQAQYIRFFPRQ